MDLSISSVDAHWSEKGAALQSVLNRLAELQSWTIDQDKDFDKWIVVLGDALGSESCARAMASRPRETAELLSWLSSPRAMRILDVIDQAEVGAAADIILAAEEMQENPAFRLFIEGIDILTRSRLLASVFSPARTKAIEAAIKLVTATKD